MPVVKIVPMPGPSGSGGSAEIADFEFIDDGGDGSFMTITDHDMTIRTLRDEDSSEEETTVAHKQKDPN